MDVKHNGRIDIACEAGADVSVSIKLPAELHNEVIAKAAQLEMSFNVTAAILIRYGLEMQKARETRITELAELISEPSKDSDTNDRILDQLGETIFGH